MGRWDQIIAVWCGFISIATLGCSSEVDRLEVAPPIANAAAPSEGDSQPVDPSSIDRPPVPTQQLTAVQDLSHHLTITATNDTSYHGQQQTVILATAKQREVALHLRSSMATTTAYQQLGLQWLRHSYAVAIHPLDSVTEVPNALSFCQQQSYQRSNANEFSAGDPSVTVPLQHIPDGSIAIICLKSFVDVQQLEDSQESTMSIGLPAQGYLLGKSLLQPELTFFDESPYNVPHRMGDVIEDLRAKQQLDLADLAIKIHIPSSQGVALTRIMGEDTRLLKFLGVGLITRSEYRKSGHCPIRHLIPESQLLNKTIPFPRLHRKGKYLLCMQALVHEQSTNNMFAKTTYAIPVSIFQDAGVSASSTPTEVFRFQGSATITQPIVGSAEESNVFSTPDSLPTRRNFVRLSVDGLDRERLAQDYQIRLQGVFIENMILPESSFLRSCGEAFTKLAAHRTFIDVTQQQSANLLLPSHLNIFRDTVMHVCSRLRLTYTTLAQPDQLRVAIGSEIDHQPIMIGEIKGELHLHLAGNPNPSKLSKKLQKKIKRQLEKGQLDITVVPMRLPTVLGQRVVTQHYRAVIRANPYQCQLDNLGPAEQLAEPTQLDVTNLWDHEGAPSGSAVPDASETHVFCLEVFATLTGSSAQQRVSQRLYPTHGVLVIPFRPN